MNNKIKSINKKKPNYFFDTEYLVDIFKGNMQLKPFFFILII